MFTGIIETTGTVTGLVKEGTNLHLKVQSPISSEMHIDQSVAHNGVCLTVTKVEGDTHWVTAVEETLKKTAIGELEEGTLVNLERCMAANGRYDGHIVQGHVDATGTIKSVEVLEGSWLYTFHYPADFQSLIVEKGSICISGISLTCFNVTEDTFTVTIIPYTHEHTNLKQLKEGDRINLEFDIIGKYVARMLQHRGM
ncbi:riboflavin synthase [Roseivirga sp. BDSF3-8]|uniref:riboflavin synthase n=1 Tax=Roseivirga sp. BDSF3-8 TaxID=3241598 RepID=UPI003532748A